MKSLLEYMILSLVSVAAMCIAGCAESPSERLRAAYRLVNERPDSAYIILREVDYNDFDEDSLKAKYILTRAMANIGVGRSLITDTLLDDAVTYYISAGDTAGWVTATQLLSGYDLMKGDPESALRRLEEMASRIKNPELLWDTHLHMLEFSFYNGDYSSAYKYADRLLKQTDVPEQILKFGASKGVSYYFAGDYAKGLAVFDSIIGTGAAERATPEAVREFYFDYAEILDGAGHSSKAIALLDSLYKDEGSINEVENVKRKVTLAQFHANAGDTDKAAELLGSVNHEATRSVFEIYSYIGMLKAALQFKESGRFPTDLMHTVTQTLHRSHRLAQFNQATALESVMELNDDNYELKLQRQRLWLIISGITLLLIVSGVIVYFIMSRRKRRMIEAEERAETLAQMLKDTEKAEEGNAGPSDSDKLKAVLLRQLGIFKTFAGTPTPQSRDALKKISAAGGGDGAIETLVDWPEFYSMIDNLYDGFHARLIKKYPDTFNDKEQQIIVLLKAGFSTKEIGVLTEQSSATIYTRKSVIRKKLTTPENGDFIAQLDAQPEGI